MSNWLAIVTDIFSTWHIARGTGLTAYVLLFLITGGGLALSLQLVPPKIRAGFLGLHRTTAIAAAIMLLLHGSILIFDRHMAFSLADVWIPFWASHKTLEMATGIIAFYTIGALVFTSLRSVLKAIGFENWRFTHYLAFPCYLLALYHGIVLGTDSAAPAIRFLYQSTASIILAMTVLRVSKSVGKRVAASENPAR
jgi:DMSO/TMAO reductase YedYZ heme-binding membrane subunit